MHLIIFFNLWNLKLLLSLSNRTAFALHYRTIAFKWLHMRDFSTLNYSVVKKFHMRRLEYCKNVSGDFLIQILWRKISKFWKCLIFEHNLAINCSIVSMMKKFHMRRLDFSTKKKHLVILFLVKFWFVTILFKTKFIYFWKLCLLFLGVIISVKIHNQKTHFLSFSFLKWLLKIWEIPIGYCTFSFFRK